MWGEHSSAHNSLNIDAINIHIDCKLIGQDITVVTNVLVLVTY